MYPINLSLSIKTFIQDRQLSQGRPCRHWRQCSLTNDNFRCRQWRQDWYRGRSGFSVFVHLFKILFMFTPNSCRVSSHIGLNISGGIYSPRNLEETPHGSPIRAGMGCLLWTLKLRRDVTFFPFVFCMVSCYIRPRYSVWIHINETNISHTGYMNLTANSFIAIYYIYIYKV